jgi:hypothetical protein
MKIYKTNFSREATDHWENFQCVREFCQNAADSDCDETFYSIGEDFIELINTNIKVSEKMWMFGLSDKRGDDTKRGKFGTGSIMAINVLTNRGINVVIQNNDVIWTPNYHHDPLFGEDVLVIEETTAENPDNNFTVRISNLSEDDISNIKQTNLAFQERKVLFSTKYGDILENTDEDGNGEIFVGELFVTQSKSFQYSYNFKPHVIKLNQDRESVSHWDLMTATSKMIVATDDVDFIKEAVKCRKSDTEHVNSYWGDNTTDEVNNSFAEDFIEEHGVSHVTSDYGDYQKLEKSGNKIVYIANEVVVKAIKESSLYKEAIADITYIEVEPLKDLIQRYLEDSFNLLYDNHLISTEQQGTDEVRKGWNHLADDYDNILHRLEEEL